MHIKKLSSLALFLVSGNVWAQIHVGRESCMSVESLADNTKRLQQNFEILEKANTQDQMTVIAPGTWFNYGGMNTYTMNSMPGNYGGGYGYPIGGGLSINAPSEPVAVSPAEEGQPSQRPPPTKDNASADNPPQLVGYFGIQPIKGVRLEDKKDIVCFTKLPPIHSKTEAECDCEVHDFPKMGKLPSLFALKKEMLCKADFTDPAWGPVLDGEIKNVQKDKIENLLMIFSKPGGFRPKSHLPALIQILESDATTEYPELVKAALQGVNQASGMLYRSLIMMNPSLAYLKGKNENVNNCRSEKEMQALRDAAEDQLRATPMPKRATARDWQMLRPLAGLLKGISKEAKEEYEDGIAESIKIAAADTPEYQGIFSSKVYYMAKEWSGQFFGEEVHTKTDLSIVRRGNLISPVVVATEPVDGNLRSDTGYGFYIQELDAIDVSVRSKKAEVGKTITKDVSWTAGGKDFTGTVKITPLADKPDYFKADSPDYEKIKTNGSLNGVIALGNSLGTNLEGISDKNFTAYYIGQGFRFAEPKPVNDVKTFLKDGISKGEFGYFIKDAHGDGDEKNMTFLNNKALLKEGVRTDMYGKVIERISLLVPQPSSGEPLSNKEFGDWVREREKNTGKQIVFINASCGSVVKATHELSETNSKALIDIPSVTSVDGFVPRGNAAFAQMLTSLREEKPFSEMRTRMELDPQYKSKSGNHFIFPDEKIYDEQIMANAKIPVSVSYDLRDEDGKPYIPFGEGQAH